MCKFKFCKGSGQCFLAETSPCSDYPDAAKPKKASKKSETTSRLTGLRYHGFMDREIVDTLYAVYHDK